MQNKRNGMRAILLTMALVLVFSALVGCSAKVNDPVVGKVGNISIHYSSYYNTYYNNMYMYSMYGMYDVSTAEKYRIFQDMTFDAIISSLLPVYIAKKNGVTLNDEEEAHLQEDLQTQIDNMYASYMEEVDAAITDETARRAEAEKLLKADLKAAGITYNAYVKQIEGNLRDQAIKTKFVDSLMAEVTVTDADVQAYYDEKLAYYQERYETDPANYYTDYSSFISNGGLEPLVVPEGYAYYKHILVLDPEEGVEKDVDAIIAEIYAKLEAGEDFDTLVAEYGEDTGMQSEPYKTTGYLLSEGTASKYYPEFSAAALALENVGDITPEGVQSEKGQHIIMKASVVEAKTIPFDEVKETIRELVQTEKEDALYEEYYAEWLKETTIKKYYSRVNGLK